MYIFNELKFHFIVDQKALKIMFFLSVMQSFHSYGNVGCGGADTKTWKTQKEHKN